MFQQDLIKREISSGIPSSIYSLSESFIIIFEILLTCMSSNGMLPEYSSQRTVPKENTSSGYEISGTSIPFLESTSGELHADLFE